MPDATCLVEVAVLVGECCTALGTGAVHLLVVVLHKVHRQWPRHVPACADVLLALEVTYNFIRAVEHLCIS